MLLRRPHSETPKAHQHAANADDYVAQGLLIPAAEEHYKAAEAYQACVEAATTALATASHSVKIRQQRADCSIAAGDMEGAVADLS